MMKPSGDNRICGFCLDYISGVCQEAEKQAFEHHLPHCPDCRAELLELRDLWEALPYVMERIEPPTDLKTQVMDALLTANPEPAGQKRNQRRFWGSRPFKAVAAAAIALFIIGTAWNVQLYRERGASSVVPLEQALSVSAAQIERLVTLTPQVNERYDSYGLACIVDNGSNKQFVVYVFGAEATRGSSVYQVWLHGENNENPVSAGTFRVNERGIGLLAMPVSGENLHFESIGITLEADERGAVPRGAKVFASS